MPRQTPGPEKLFQNPPSLTVNQNRVLLGNSHSIEAIRPAWIAEHDLVWPNHQLTREDPMTNRYGFHVLLMTTGIGLLAACDTGPSEEQIGPHVTGGTDVEQGRYLVIVGGCNDCHTDGYLPTNGDVPEAQWLLGSPVGFRGPWGTTYASNLRLLVGTYTEDQWVDLLHTRTSLPPMPWMNINQMAEADMRALYRYIGSLGAAGEIMPLAVPPDEDPTTPYVSLEPILPGG